MVAEVPDKNNYLDYLKPIGVHTTIIQNTIEFTWLTSTLPDSCTLTTVFSSSTITKYSSFLYFHYIYKFTLPHALYKTLEKYEISCTRGEFFASREFPISISPSLPYKILFLADFSTSKIGDLANYQHTQVYKPNILSILKKDLENIESIWHLGDFAYDLFSNQGQRGLEFLLDIEPIASKIPYIAVVGNHEIQNNYKSFMRFFGNGLYFVRTIGNAKIIAISSEFDFYLMKPNLFPYKHSFWQYLKQKQEKWLIEILNGIDREEFPWVVVVAHKPLYCSINKASSMIMQACVLHARVMRDGFEDIFLQYQVDLGIFGHIHLYERTRPVAYLEVVGDAIMDSNYIVNPRAPIYIVNGVAGNLESADILFDITDEPAEWSCVIKESLGYGILTFFNYTHLKYEQFSFGKTQWDNAFEDLYTTKRIDDFFWIIKSGI